MLVFEPLGHLASEDVGVCLKHFPLLQLCLSKFVLKSSMNGRHRAQSILLIQAVHPHMREKISPFPGGMEALWEKGSIAPVSSIF